MKKRLTLSWIAAWIATAGGAVAITTELGAAPERLEIENGATVIPLDLSQGRPVVGITINRVGPFRVVFDTGGVGLMIDADLAAELALPIVGVGRVSSPMGDADGLEVQQARIDRLELGGVTLSDLLVDLWDSKRNPIFTGVDSPRGIFGITLLRDALVTLDLSGGRLEVASGSLPEAGPGIVEIDLDQGLPVVSVDIAGQSIPAHLDSGNPGTLLLPLALSSRLPLESPLTLAGRARTVDAVVEIYRATIAEPVTLAGHRLENLEVRFIAGTPWANIGVGLLRRYLVSMDLRGRRARFTDLQAEGTARPENVRNRGASPP